MDTYLNISISDANEISDENESVALRKTFTHKSFEDRLQEYGGKISVCDHDWGEPQGRERL